MRNMAFLETCMLLFALTPAMATKGAPEVVVLVTDFDGSIYRYDMNKSTLTTIPISSDKVGVGDIDYDPITGKIYWANIRQDHIKRVNLDGSDEEIIHPNTETTRGVAVDSTRQLLFFAEEKFKLVGKVNLTDMNRTTIFENLDKPDSITLDTHKQLMFWSLMGSSPKIEMASYNGTGRKSLVNSGVKWATGLVLDDNRERLYWCDGGLKKVKYIHLVTMKVTLLLDTSGAHYYDIDFLGGTVFLIDVNELHTFHTMPADGGAVTTVRLRGTLSKWRKLKVITITACEDYKWGRDCNKTCGNCLDDAICNKRNGHCYNGCITGFAEPICLKACPRGTYGRQCSSTCGHCYSAQSCSPVNGTCLTGCQPGWDGRLCNDECPVGQHGANCSSRCGRCRSGEVCDKTTGECSDGCDPGWQGNQCKKECDDGWFGVDCQYECQCQEVCHKLTGECPRAPVTDTVIECKDGWFGVNCQYQCQCQEVCDKLTGECPKQDHVTANVIVCESGRYGRNCSDRCGQCQGGEPCNQVTGDCPGACSAGWEGAMCKTPCDSGRYGINCAKTCSCSGSQLCDSKTGKCIQPARQYSNGKPLATGLIVVVVILVILLVIAVVIIFRRRHKRVLTVTDDDDNKEKNVYFAFQDDQ